MKAYSTPFLEIKLYILAAVICQVLVLHQIRMGQSAESNPYDDAVSVNTWVAVSSIRSDFLGVLTVNLLEASVVDLRG